MFSSFAELIVKGTGPLALGRIREQRLLAVWPTFLDVGDRTGIPPELLAGLAWTESDFVPTARNPESQAAGLFQVMPFHFQSLGWTGDDWSDPLKNTEAGAAILVQHGLGRKPVSAVLKGYGGFVTKDPSQYISSVLSRTLYILAWRISRKVGE